MKLPWKDSIDIADGSHNGEISKITYRTEPYEYTDIWIRFQDEDVELKYGCPTNLTAISKLGRLLIAMGTDFSVGSEVDIDQTLIGKKVHFMTMKKPGKKSGIEFSEIIEDSIKPLN